MHMGIDVGYGFVKGVSGSGGRCCFPSVVTAARTGGDIIAALGGRAPRHRVELERVSGGPESWWVGQAAVAAGGKRSWEMAASQRRGYDVLVLAALALLGASGPVAVGVGLPLALYAQKQERRTLRRRLEGLGAWVSVDAEPARYIEVAAAEVLPQSAGAYYAALLAPGGDRLARAPVGVIDVGYRTTDYLLLEPQEDGGVAPDETRSGSVDLGIGQVYDAVRSDLTADLGMLVPDEVVERALNQGGLLYVHGQEKNIGERFTAATRDLAERVEAEVRRVWAQRLDFVAAALLAGGGGAALAEHLTLPAVSVVSEPLHANAIGFARMAALTGAP